MTDIITPPVIDPAPPAPQRQDEETFEPRADAFAAYTTALPDVLTAVAANVNNNATAAEERATAADTSATKAKDWAESASAPGAPGTMSAKSHAQAAEAAKQSAQAAAAAAGDAAGLPKPLVPGFVLTALSGNTVGWADPQQGSAGDVWAMQPIGMYLAMAPGSPLPPTDDPTYRYVVLSAGLSGQGDYNEGVLVDESVTGSDPTITASAEVSLPGSPFDGTRIALVNTSRTFLRPAEAGSDVPVDSTNLSHTHTGSTSSAGSHSHSGSTSSDGNHSHGYTYKPHANFSLATPGTTYGLSTNQGTTLQTSQNGVHSHSVSTNTSGSHSHSMSLNASGSAESAPRHLSRVYIMRIL